MGVFILQVKFDFFDFMGIDCQTVNKTHINIRSNYPKHPSSPTLLYLKIIQFQKVNCTLSSLHVKWIGDFVVSADHKIRKLRINLEELTSILYLTLFEGGGRKSTLRPQNGLQIPRNFSISI